MSEQKSKTKKFKKLMLALLLAVLVFTPFYSKGASTSYDISNFQFQADVVDSADNEIRLVRGSSRAIQFSIVLQGTSLNSGDDRIGVGPGTDKDSVTIPVTALPDRSALTNGFYVGLMQFEDFNSYCANPIIGQFVYCDPAYNYANSSNSIIPSLVPGSTVQTSVTLDADRFFSPAPGVAPPQPIAEGGYYFRLWVNPIIERESFSGTEITGYDAVFNRGKWIVLRVFADQAALAEAEPLPAGLQAPTGPGTSLSGGKSLGDVVEGGIISAISVVLGAITGIIRWVVWTLTTLIAVPLLEETLKLGASGLAAGPIQTGWNLVRDVVNMFFILFLIVIGFGTILRIESYGYRKLLVNLIIMAMLVNFSLVIGRIIIQIADVAQFAFLPVTESGTAVRSIFQNLSTAHITSIFDGFRSFSLDQNTAMSNLFNIIFQFILELGVAITFIALALFMLIRTAALWILLILSPAAYAFFVIPATSGLSRMWWSNFIKYALFAPIMAFFIRLTAELYTKGLQLFPSQGSWGSDQGDLITLVNRLGQTQGTSFTQALDLALIYVAILAFLWAGLIVARQMGIAGAGAILNLAERGMKLGAIGVPAKMGGFVGRVYSNYIGRKSFSAMREHMKVEQAEFAKKA